MAFDCRVLSIQNILFQTTETMESQEINFRKKLKSRRTKFDRKFLKNRLLVKDRCALDVFNNIAAVIFPLLHITEMIYWRIG